MENRFKAVAAAVVPTLLLVALLPPSAVAAASPHAHVRGTHCARVDNGGETVIYHIRANRIPCAKARKMLVQVRDNGRDWWRFGWQRDATTIAPIQGGRLWPGTGPGFIKADFAYRGD